MNLFTFLFIGNSGCGKGTQGALLRKHLEEKYVDSPVYYMETGNGFRDFLAGHGHSNDLARKIYEAGHRQPDFLAIWGWAHLMIESMTGKEHLIIDGAARSLVEGLALLTAMKFYGRNLIVVHLDVSREWSKKHLTSRARADDIDMNKVERRLDWFEKDVAPVIDFFKTSPECTFVSVNGEQTIEQVNSEMMEKLKI